MTLIASSSSLFAFVLMSLLITPSSAISEADVDAVCARTLDPTFCSQYLHSIPNLSTATFSNLCRTAITAAKSDAGNTVQFINTLLPQIKDPGSKQAVAGCLQNYNSAIGTLGDALNALAAGNIRAVRVATSQGVFFGLDCQRHVQGTGVPLDKNNQSLENYCSVAEQLSERLLFRRPKPSIKDK